MSEWKEMALGDFMTLQRGFDLPESSRVAGDFPVIASTGVVGNHNKAMVKGPGVIIGRSGSIGGGQFIQGDFWPLNTTLWIKDFKGNDPRFCYYLLKSLDLTRFNAGSGVPTLNRNHIHPLRIKTTVSVTEQKAIAHILGSLDDKIELNRRMNETLEAMARAIFKDWFVDFGPTRAKQEGRNPYLPEHLWSLFPEAIDPQSGLPIGWKILSLGEMGKVVTGKTPSTKVPEYFGGDIPFITPSDMKGGKGIHKTTRSLTSEGVNAVKNSLIPAGSIAVSCIGSVGKVAYVVRESVTNQQINSIISSEEYSNEFLYYNLVGRKDELQNLSRGGSAVPILNKSHFSQIKTVIPLQPLLRKFDLIANSITDKDFANEEESRTLAELRDRLLPKLMSGEIRVKDAEKLVEEVL